jgi:hypothetical protein
MLKETQTETVAIAPTLFLAKVGASDPASVLLSDADIETVRYWENEIKNGSLPTLTIEFDCAGNVIGADGRHRALAARRVGVPRIPVEIRRVA